MSIYLQILNGYRNGKKNLMKLMYVEGKLNITLDNNNK